LHWSFGRFNVMNDVDWILEVLKDNDMKLQTYLCWICQLNVAKHQFWMLSWQNICNRGVYIKVGWPSAWFFRGLSSIFEICPLSSERFNLSSIFINCPFLLIYCPMINCLFDWNVDTKIVEKLYPQSENWKLEIFFVLYGFNPIFTLY